MRRFDGSFDINMYMACVIQSGLFDKIDPESTSPPYDYEEEKKFLDYMENYEDEPTTSLAPFKLKYEKRFDAYEKLLSKKYGVPLDENYMGSSNSKCAHNSLIIALSVCAAVIRILFAA